jgi:thiamine-monophosphate kinase
VSLPRRSRLSGEDRLLAWLRSRYALPHLGDDAAMLALDRPFAVTTDSQIEGVHFPPGLDPGRIARRLLAINLSDLAAMGAEPRFAFLALAVPEGFAHRRFFRALLAACRPHGVELAGGDLARSPRLTYAVLTLLGTLPSRGRWLRRDGARPGQRLWLGGTVGESAAGQLLAAMGTAGKLESSEGVGTESPAIRRAARHALDRHLEPRPQLDLGRWLGRRKAGGALDVSDGLARDLHRLCRASGCGATVDGAALPLAPRFAELCRALDRDPLELALAGGEDYVLLFTLPPGLAPPQEFCCTEIGSIDAGTKVRCTRAGRTRALPPLGWDHLGM